MKRKTCSICNKKRYEKFILKVPYIYVVIGYNLKNHTYVCSSGQCLKQHINKLSVQVGQLNSIINDLNELL